MSVHTTVLFLHILFAVIWVGGNIHSEALQRSVERDGTRAKVIDNYSQVGRVNRHLFLLPSWGVIGTGIWLVTESGHQWSDLWVAAALVLSAFAAAFGVLVLTPRGRAVSKMLGDPSAHAEAAAEVARMRRLRIMHTALLTLILILMVFRPNL